MRMRQTHQAKDGQRRHLPGLGEPLFFQIEQRAVAIVVRIVDQDVQTAQLVHRGGDQSVALFELADIAGHRDRVATPVSDLGGRCLEVARRAATDHDTRTGLAQRQGEAPAHSLAGPGDDGDLTFQHTVAHDASRNRNSSTTRSNSSFRSTWAQCPQLANTCSSAFGSWR